MKAPRPVKGPIRLRDPLVSGIFYPDDPSALRDAVDSLLLEAVPVREDAKSILVPHAAIAYTGALQALAFAAARSRPIKTIVFLSPRHRPDEDSVFLPESWGFRSPLGDFYVDMNLLEALEGCGTFYEKSDIPHLEEHAIEVQLPFVSRLFPDASILPIILNVSSPQVARQVAQDLDDLLADKAESTLLVAISNAGSSSDPRIAREASDSFLSWLLSPTAQRLADTAFTPSRTWNESSPCGILCAEVLRSSSYFSGRDRFLLGRTNSAAAEAKDADQGAIVDAKENEGPHGYEIVDTIVEYAAAAFY